MSAEPGPTPTPQPSPPEARPLDPRKLLGIMFLLIGSGGAIAGATHLLGLFTLPYDPLRLGDALENLAFGALNLVAWRLALKGRMLSMGLFLVSVTLSVVYSFMVGRGLNYIMVFIGFYIAIQALRLRRMGVLS